MSYGRTGVLRSSVAVFHAYVTKYDGGGHMGKIRKEFEKLPSPSQGRNDYDNWQATAPGATDGLCCILSDGVTGPDALPAGGCQRPTQAGAHVYDTTNENASAEECVIIPTCNYHNNSVGNTNRGQNWGEYPTGDANLKPQRVKTNTPFIVRNIKAAVRVEKGKGKGKGHPFPVLGGPYVPEANNITPGAPGAISPDILNRQAHTGPAYPRSTKFLDPTTGNYIP